MRSDAPLDGGQLAPATEPHFIVPNCIVSIYSFKNHDTNLLRPLPCTICLPDALLLPCTAVLVINLP